jgi:hypothetical protein
MSERLPRWIAKSQREWKAKKRREWKAVVKATKVFLMGAAFTPIEIIPILRQLEAEGQRLSVRNWGR